MHKKEAAWAKNKHKALSTNILVSIIGTSNLFNTMIISFQYFILKNSKIVAEKAIIIRFSNVWVYSKTMQQQKKCNVY